MLIIAAMEGCIQSQDSVEDKDNSLIPNNYERIIGTWYNSGSIENSTKAIVYTFYSNLSFFTGFYDYNMSNYINPLWGTYEINNTTISLTIAGINISNSALKYSFSEDFNNLVLFFNGNDKYIIFKKL